MRVSFQNIDTDRGLSITSRSTDGERVIIAGSKLHDIIKAGQGTDFLLGSAGNDKLFGNEGRDYFIFSQGDGKDQVSNFETGTDVLNVGDLARSMDDLTLTAVNRGQDTLITFAGQSAADQSVLLHDVRVAELTSTDFLFGA